MPGRHFFGGFLYSDPKEGRPQVLPPGVTTIMSNANFNDTKGFSTVIVTQ